MSGLIFAIAGVDYSANGALDLTSLTIEPAADSSSYGTASFRLAFEGGGGLFINDHQEVKIYELDSSGNCSWRWFGGFVTHVVLSAIGGTKIWEITCRDYSELLDTVIRENTAVTIGAARLSVQISDIVTACAPTLAKSRVGTFSGSTVLPAFTFQNMTLRQALDIVLANLRAAGWPQADYSLGVATDYVLDPLPPRPGIVFYDRAATGGSVIDFSDIPTGSQQPIFLPFSRVLDGAQLSTRVLVRGADGLVGIAEIAAAKTAYPNPYSTSNSWAKIVTDSSLTTQAACDARALAEVTALAYSRETIMVDTFTRVTPGQLCTISNVFENLSSAPYAVVRVRVSFANPMRPRLTLELGNALLELGEAGNGTSRGQSRDVTPPDPPTGLITATNSYDPISNSTLLIWTWNASLAGDTNGYSFGIKLNGGAETFVQLGRGLSYARHMPPFTTFIVRVAAYDYSGNTSAYTAGLPGTADSAPPPAVAPLNPGFENALPTDPTLPANWAITLDSGATATRVATPAAGEGQWCMDLYSPDNIHAATITSTPFSAAASQSYFLRVLTKTTGTTANFPSILDWYNAAGTLIGSTTVLLKADTAWSGALNTCVPIAGSSFAKLRIRNTNPNNTPVHLYVDGVIWSPQAPPEGIANGAVTVPKLDLSTSSGTPIQIKALGSGLELLDIWATDNGGGSGTTNYVNIAASNLNGADATQVQLTSYGGVGVVIGEDYGQSVRLLPLAPGTHPSRLYLIAPGSTGGTSTEIHLGADTVQVFREAGDTATPNRSGGVLQNQYGELITRVTNDSYGGASFTLHNRSGENGAILSTEFTDTTIRLADLILRYRTGVSTTAQSTVRLEGRAAQRFTSAGPEFQIGAPGDPDLAVSTGGTLVRHGDLTAAGAVNAVGGFKANGTTGITKTVTLAKLTTGGSTGSLTFTNGILTAAVDPT